MATISTQLLTRVQKGDPEAIGEFCNRYGTQIRSWIRLWGLNGRARSVRGSEDVQQSVFLIFCVAAANGEFRDCGADQIHNWLMKVAKNHLVDILRRELAQKRGGGKIVEMDVEPPCPESGVVSSVVRRENQEMCLKALARLDQPDRQLLVDRYLKGIGVVPLAKKHNVAPGTISKRVDKAKSKFCTEFPVSDN